MELVDELLYGAMVEVAIEEVELLELEVTEVDDTDVEPKLVVVVFDFDEVV